MICVLAELPSQKIQELQPANHLARGTNIAAWVARGFAQQPPTVMGDRVSGRHQRVLPGGLRTGRAADSALGEQGVVVTGPRAVARSVSA